MNTDTSYKAISGIEKQVLAPATALAYKNTEATAITLRNGDILLLWTEFLNTDLLPAAEQPPARQRGRGDDGYARISGRLSQDGGRTWSAPWVVIDDHDAMLNVMSPALTRLADGRLLLAYSWRSGGNPHPGYAIASGEAARRVRISADEGQSWSDPVRITPDDGGYHTGCHDRAYTLPSGRVLVQCHSRFDQPGPPATWRRMTTWLAYSDDQGQSWHAATRLDEPRSPKGFAEGSLVQRGDGSLLMVLRTTLGQAFYTESTDDGATWSPPSPSGIITPAAPTLLARLPHADDLLLVWNSNYNPDAEYQGRCPLLCAVSRDGGRTWGLPKALETDPTYGWAYPGLLLHGDHVLLHYFRSPVGTSERSLLLARIPLTWFYEFG